MRRRTRRTGVRRSEDEGHLRPDYRSHPGARGAGKAGVCPVGNAGGAARARRRCGSNLLVFPFIRSAAASVEHVGTLGQPSGPAPAGPRERQQPLAADDACTTGHGAAAVQALADAAAWGASAAEPEVGAIPLAPSGSPARRARELPQVRESAATASAGAAPALAVRYSRRAAANAAAGTAASVRAATGSAAGTAPTAGHAAARAPRAPPVRFTQSSPPDVSSGAVPSVEAVRPGGTRAARQDALSIARPDERDSGRRRVPVLVGVGESRTA